MPMNRHPASNDVPPVFRYLVQQYAIELANAQVDTAALIQEFDEALRGKLYHEEINHIRLEQAKRVAGMVDDLAAKLSPEHRDVEWRESTEDIRDLVDTIQDELTVMLMREVKEERKGDEDCGCGNHDAGRHRPDGPGSDQQD